MSCALIFELMEILGHPRTHRIFLAGIERVINDHFSIILNYASGQRKSPPAILKLQKIDFVKIWYSSCRWSSCNRVQKQRNVKYLSIHPSKSEVLAETRLSWQGKKKKIHRNEQKIKVNASHG